MLTKNHILSYKDEKVYKNPTEIIQISQCCTVKSVEEEINKAHSFVRHKVEIILGCRNWISKGGLITCRRRTMRRRRAG